ncbi:hypothetical protein HPC62_22395 [Thermoleptolyngbya sichuanensis A183]|uniref:Uncharacterized protein n=1 Tax=Thermoleptolyngbya sichuanensis A183 TaxID=2737172 RepID=A0A6M8BI64_9CYAN|nr:hypothetical protein [Thermoleptolyngbya sichuanensis]QKD84567.1 hypothetical protein HPC62_22395 [Thermoleptolyngbya sichuanensis A183]
MGKKLRLMRVVGIFGVGAIALLSCSPALASLSKISFDLSQVSPEGLVGPADGGRSLRYEFCIPRSAKHQAEVQALNVNRAACHIAQRSGAKHQAEVQALNPAIEFYPHSPGRIRCSAAQILCMGETHSPNWRETLLNLAQLDYVERIDEFYGE